MIFKYKWRNTIIVGDQIGRKAQVLCLHGAGLANRRRFKKFRETLYSHGLSSISFDFPGQGDSGGELKSSSLKERFELTIDLLKAYDVIPTVIVGSSMSGDTSVRLLKVYDVQCITLIVPAVYDKSAYNLIFSDAFTECIRQKQSYLNNDTWNILKNYKGKVILVSAKHDTVIPKDVIQGYKANCRNLVHIEVDCEHKILTQISQDTINEIANEIIISYNS